MNTKGKSVVLNDEGKFLSYDGRNWVTTDGQFLVTTFEDAVQRAGKLMQHPLDVKYVVKNYGYANEKWNLIMYPNTYMPCEPTDFGIKGEAEKPAIAPESLVKFAKADLADARSKGEILICQTKRGTLSLKHAKGVYTLTATGLTPEVLATGKPAVVVPVLAGLYEVVVEPSNPTVI